MTQSARGYWFKKIARVVLSCCAPSLAVAADDGAECFSKYTKTNVCDYARKAQAQAVPTLPMRLNAQVSVTSVMAIGPRLVFVAQWNLTSAQAQALVQERGTTMQEWGASVQKVTQNSVCTQESTAAFIRLGGEVQYIYKGPDGSITFSPLVASCTAGPT